MKLFIAFGVCAALSSELQAQPASVILHSPDWARGSVVTDGAAVYSAPDFDAHVVEYLNGRSSVYILKKPVSGQSGMGLFYRVRYRNKAGYMVDTDIQFPGKAGSEKAAETKLEKKRRSGDEGDRKPGMEPLYFTRYVGLAFASVDFTEKFSGKKLNDQLSMAGLRFSGPGALFGSGPPLDVNIWMALQKPGYYDRFASEVSGFMLFGDINLMLPFSDSRNGLWYYELGPMWAYTHYKVKVKDTSLNSQELRLGFNFDVGYAYRFGRFAIRGDVQYFWEKTQYFGFGLAAQSEF